MRDIQEADSPKVDLLNGHLETLTAEQLKLQNKREKLLALYLESAVPKELLDRQDAGIAAQLERIQSEM